MKNPTYQNFLSHIAKTARPSPMREMFKIIGTNKDLISFAGGMPDPRVFPIVEFASSARLLQEQGEKLLQYSPTEGDSELMDFLVHWNTPRLGRTASLDEIFIATGSQQIIDLISWSVLDAGDIVLTDDPSYASALSVFSNHGAQILCVDSDEHGMDMDALQTLLKELEKSGKKVKFLYSIVNFNNPSGAVLSLARRKKLVELADDFDFLILEDDPYGYLRYEGEHLPSVYSLNPKRVIYAGSFSKILSPAVRIGWAIGPKEIIRQMVIFRQSVDLCPSQITQSLVLDYCKNGYLDSHLPKILGIYRIKLARMIKEFSENLAPLGVSWNAPKGGFFFWINIKNTGIKADDLAAEMLKHNVAVVSGKAFCVNENNAQNFMRCNFSFPNEDEIAEGVRRMKTSILNLQS